MEGSVIGQYRVTKKLGEGGMGAVFAGEHALIGRKAAIKMLLPSLSQNQEIVQRFFNEARAATAIQDPGIVQIFDFGYHTDGSAYIVMEYLEGEPLDSRLKRLGRLNAFDALRIMRQAASSLAAAHSRGIIHRDLKPENIYLVADREVAGGERPKLLDFGIAKLTGDAESKVKTHTSAIMGTPMYMSPEQCRGAGQVDARSDVYALGCVIFHLIVGRPPFDGEGVGEIIAAHLREPPPIPSQFVPGLPPEVDQLVARCLVKQVEHRFQSAAELADAIGWLLGQGGQPMGAVHPSGQYAAPAAPTTLSGASGVRWNTGNTGGPIVPPSGVGVGGAPQQKSKVGVIVGAVGAVAVAAVAVIVLSSGSKGDGGGGGGTQQPAAGPAAAPAPAPASAAPVAEVKPPDPPPVTPPAPAVEVDAGTSTAVAAAPESEDKGDSRSSRDKKKKDRDKKSDPKTQPPSGTSDKPPESKCNNGVPGDTDCDGIPDTRL
jgi:eukaryotic-like serine/threonine-protein kinase